MCIYDRESPSVTYLLVYGDSIERTLSMSSVNLRGPGGFVRRSMCIFVVGIFVIVISFSATIFIT